MADWPRCPPSDRTVCLLPPRPLHHKEEHTTIPPPSGNAVEGTTAVVESDERVKITGGLRKLLWWMMPANLGVFILWGAIPGVLLPLQMESLDAAHKVANLALVSTIGAFAAMIAQPIAGAVSDRTRSRFGRRAPWMVGGAVVGGLALILFAVVLFLTVVPVSPGGDYIAAGC